MSNQDMDVETPISEALEVIIKTTVQLLTFAVSLIVVMSSVLFSDTVVILKEVDRKSSVFLGSCNVFVCLLVEHLQSIVRLGDDLLVIDIDSLLQD